MRCVLLSDALDLRSYLSGIIHELDHIEFVDHAPGEVREDIDIAIAWYPPNDAFEAYPRLKAVASIGAGADGILACPSLRPEIEVLRVIDPDQAKMMSGFVLWHVVWHQRQFGTYLQHQRDKIWERLVQRGAKDVPVGILGYGEIGGRVASDLATLGFPVHVWSRTEKSTPDGILGFHGSDGLSALLGKAEVLINLLPLTPETRNILNVTTLNQMRRGGYLIHVGRGDHLVEEDLLAVLESGQLSGASLDVFRSEPLPPGHPFWSHPKIVVTPHDACDVSMEATKNTIAKMAERVRNGQRSHQAVDQKRGY